jgi:phospholipid/cholesterol/gamma-HCH transport system substrate-binding protein
MGGNLVETLIGAVVLAVAAGFLFFAYGRTDVGAVVGYQVTAKFERVDGLNVGSDVRMSGIKVGTVLDQTLDGESFLAVVRLSIDPSIKLPEDSSAEVVSDGLLGSKYMSLVPGGAEDVIEDGGEILYTQSSVSLEQLIGKFMFSSDKKEAPAKN